MRLLTKKEKEIYEGIIKGITVKIKLTITKPPEGFKEW